MHFNSDHVYMIGRVTRRMLPHLWGPRIQCKQALRGSFPSLSLSLSLSLAPRVEKGENPGNEDVF